MSESSNKNYVRDHTRRYLNKHERDIAFEATEGHRLADIRKKLEGYRDAEDETTEQINLEFHAKILRDNITTLLGPRGLKSRMANDPNFRPATGTGVGYVAHQIIHGPTMKITGDHGDKLQILIPQWRNEQRAGRYIIPQKPRRRNRDADLEAIEHEVRAKQDYKQIEKQNGVKTVKHI